MAKLTKLTPVLIERTCEECGDGLLAYKNCKDVSTFFKTKFVHEYECNKCGVTITSNNRLRLKEIAFVDEATKTVYRNRNDFVFITKME